MAPHLEVSSPPNARKYPHLNIQEDRGHLLESLESTVEENMGMVMIFTIVDTLKEGAQLLISERQAADRAMEEFEASQAEEEENRKFQGTTVTKETFLEWREKFRQEIAEEERKQREERELEEKKKKTAPPKEAKRLTGRQLWESGVADKGDFDEDNETSLPAKVEKMALAT